MAASDIAISSQIFADEALFHNNGEQRLSCHFLHIALQFTIRDNHKEAKNSARVIGVFPDLLQFFQLFHLMQMALPQTDPNNLYPFIYWPGGKIVKNYTY